MVKLGKNKLKILNKLSKKQNASPINASNKVLKKKINVEKKVTFQKEVLLRETVKSESLVQNVSKTDLALKNLFKNTENSKQKVENKVTKPKLKPVEKKKKRRNTQINDTKLLLNLMKKKS